jgi:hypothetical protein
MPKGLKETSSLIAISAQVTETAANTFTSQRVDLQLNPLDNEVFIVYAIDLDAQQPDNIDTVTSTLTGSLSTTQRTTVGGIEESNVMAASRQVIQNLTTNAIYTEFKSDSTPTGMLEYIGIIATNDFYLNLAGINNGAAKAMNARVFGVRARADASVYAALVQSEVLS